ncbi:MAG: helix-turn-helix domain-containing protein [Bacteroidales bacterium]
MVSGVADVIKHIRKKRDWSQRKLAGKAGISHTLLSDIERERCNPSLKTLRKIADALDISISQIFLQAEYGKSVHKENK